MPSVCFLIRAHHHHILKITDIFDFGRYPVLIDDGRSSAEAEDYLNKSMFPALDRLLQFGSEAAGQFRCCINVSGVLLDITEKYHPDLYRHLGRFLNADLFEPVISPYFHPVIPLKSQEELSLQISMHREKIHAMSGQKSEIICDADLMMHGLLAEIAITSGFEAMIVEVSGNTMPAGPFYRLGKSHDLKIAMVNDKMRQHFNLQKNTRKQPDRSLLKDLLKYIGDATVEEYIIPVDLYDLPEPEAVLQKVEFLLLFAGEALEQDKALFSNMSGMLSGKEPENIPEITHFPAEDLPGSVLGREAVKFLYNLEEKVKNAGDRRLLYLWRVLHGVEHLDKLAKNPEHPAHKIFLEYMNALSCLDIYTNRVTDRIS